MQKSSRMDDAFKTFWLVSFNELFLNGLLLLLLLLIFWSDVMLFNANIFNVSLYNSASGFANF